MKFIKLEILNLASLDRQEGETINFEEGALGESTIFSIVGPTGSGKSTILDAICLALYNVAPRYPRTKGARNQNIEIYGTPEEGERNRLAPTDSRNILTRGRKEGYSKLTFLANNGNVYRAEWYVRKKTKNYDDAITSLYRIGDENGTPGEYPDDWSKLPDIIGLDYDQFLRTVLIAQGSFAGFLKAKENERYELLEKLIGCRELYTGIAERIKTRRDDAVRAYNAIVANVSAQEKDLIPDAELEAVKTRAVELEAVAKKAKDELKQISDSIAWYADEEKLIGNIAKYEQAFNKALEKKNGFAAQGERLALHDAAVPAVNIYREIKTSEANIEKCEADMNSLRKSIADKKEEIRVEEEEYLAKLKETVRVASEELDRQKPHINRAREIKVELEGLNNQLKEKKSTEKDAEEALRQAQKALADNARNIDNAAKNLQKSQENLGKLIAEIKKGEDERVLKAEKARTDYDEQNNVLDKCDAEKLQDAKSLTEKAKTDIGEAIRIQGDLKTKTDLRQANLTKQTTLTERNLQIELELGQFDIEKQEKELERLRNSYNLMTGENWDVHRGNLVEGEPCPLCGATHHPYHVEEVFAPVVDELKNLIDEKSAELKKLKETKEKLIGERSKNDGFLDGIKTVLESCVQEIDSLHAQWLVIHGAHESWPEDIEALEKLRPEVVRRAKDASDRLTEYNTLVKKVEKLRKEKDKTESDLQKYREESQNKKQASDKRAADAQIKLETEKGKTGNLTQQLEEKTAAHKTACEQSENVKAAVIKKSDELRQEIGERDPDKYEKELTDAKTSADNAVKKMADAIAAMRERLKETEGKHTATASQKESEERNLKDKKSALQAWIDKYNDSDDVRHIDADTVAALFAATDNWEEMRATQKSLDEAFTSADTTLHNETKALEDHRTKKPEQQREELLDRKSALESQSDAELIETKARLQRHEAAKEQMGVLFDQRREAENLKVEWEEIVDAIGGSDGKTLRKIAQCYTLRFLVEHANAEIRRFNGRYELQQVKNSLGIRVIDHDRADDVRDTTSLSGGETFIVSLGLALGLSALSSRNISFGNLFIDEGFGTLDPETLATVIDSLAMLQSSQGKKVGVISHTDTMSERITTQIRVIKNGNSGSSRIEIYP